MYSPFYTVACLVPAAKNVYGFPPPPPLMQPLRLPSSPPPSLKDRDQGPPPAPASSLQLLMHPLHPLLPVAVLPPDPAQQPSHSSSHTFLHQWAHWSSIGCCPPLVLPPALLLPWGLQTSPPAHSFNRVNRVCRTGSVGIAETAGWEIS